MSTYNTGLSGEEKAEQYLTGLGYHPLHRRYRGQDGEIDLILRDGDYIVFTEVKYRPGGFAGEGLMAVTPRKQRRMVNAALAYLVEMELIGYPVRFDVVEITRDGVRHVINAFQPG